VAIAIKNTSRIKTMPYAKGQSGNPNGRKGHNRSTDAPPLLVAMRHVLRSEATDKESGMRAHCRKLLSEDYMVFMKQLAQLEQAYLRSKQPKLTAKDRNAAVATSPVQANEHDGELKELITSLLEGFK
jgi:hypothetical protein